MIQLCFSGKSNSFLELKFAEDLSSLVQLHTNLTANTSKFSFINDSLRSVDSECGLTVVSTDSKLEVMYSSKDLGIHLDRGMT